jgi:hypothetical protein
MKHKSRSQVACTLIAAAMSLAIRSAACAEIIHAYILVEARETDAAGLEQGMSPSLGMCKYVVVGEAATEKIGIDHIIVRLDCQNSEGLNALVSHIAGIRGVQRVSVLEAYAAR